MNPTPHERAAYARRIFVHYFRMAIEGNGKAWDSDYEAEINGAVDDLLAAAMGMAPIKDEHGWINPDWVDAHLLHTGSRRNAACPLCPSA